MRQSRLMSLIEAVANVIIGHGVAVLTQALLFPLLVLAVSFRQNLALSASRPVPRRITGRARSRRWATR